MTADPKVIREVGSLQDDAHKMHRSCITYITSQHTAISRDRLKTTRHTLVQDLELPPLQLVRFLVLIVGIVQG